MALPCHAEWFCSAQNTAELIQAQQWAKTHHLPIAVLGGGSNVLLPEFQRGLVILMAEQGWQEMKREHCNLWVRVAAGQNWHDWVAHCVENELYGLENLALIPGTVGAAPIQNIGAYGVEVGSVVESVTWLNFNSLQVSELNAEDCQFAYRDSVFKNKYRGLGAITHVTFKLCTDFNPCLSYPGLNDCLQLQPGSKAVITAQDVFRAVCSIRQEKLPDPNLIPNSGSFFKNPIIGINQFETLKKTYPRMPSFSVADTNFVKLPAAWLIEQAGWKGREGNGFFIHSQHALIITNPKRQNLVNLLKFADDIINSVAAKFNIVLEPEPQILSQHFI